MNILTSDLKLQIDRELIETILSQNYDAAIDAIPRLIDALYANIPDNKRISYGIVHTIKTLSEFVHTRLEESKEAIDEIGVALFKRSAEGKVTGVALGVLSLCVRANFSTIAPYFKLAAASELWEIREFAQLFFRRLIKAHPEEAQKFLLKLVESEDANIRRFVGETLRSVQENKWFYKNPEYPLSILKQLFKESAAYPRTAVGNNLSDLARRLPDLVYGIIEELVASGDKNSYWIAYRACRNLVKKEPLRVMNLLKVDEYTYKTRIHRRCDHE
ncbi:hypothetical protein JXJ21_06060 [candidate division KSB1 bacterium]|nr:hypothetical protein [candidate division KSB1 bacterium]